MMQIDSKTRKILNKRQREDNKGHRAARHERSEKLFRQRIREQEQQYA